MPDKMYTIAGTSKLNGVKTYRFANGKLRSRISVLRRNDHTEIALFELPDPMAKEAAIAWLKEQGVDAVKPVTGRLAASSALTEEQKQELAAADEAAEAAQLAEDAAWVIEQL